MNETKSAPLRQVHRLGRPELLAPAGDWDCARAAVENGADAIYFGLERFNARMRARNFSTSDLPELMTFLHRRGVKGYVTFNTLVFANEMAEAEEHLRAIIAAGADAVIVQDVGICRLIRRLSPNFPIHASTQMTVTSAAGVRFASELGCNLVVLARECSLAEMEKIQSEQTGSVAMPLEVFVHGALCVAYSGQCLTSEALGGRSANRGECAQACRMPYELISDGQTVPLGDRRYLLSPQDLAGLPALPGLMEAGIASLKIEGRLKTPEYVASITRVYRETLDQLVNKHQGNSDAEAVAERSWDASRYELEMAFSRGLSTGWLRGINNQTLVHARFGKKRGVFLGNVEAVADGKVSVRLLAPLQAGDGIVFDAGHPEQEEEGGRVYTIDVSGPRSWLSFGLGTINWRNVHPGDKLWKTSDPELQRQLRRTFDTAQPNFQRPLCFDVSGIAGQPLRVRVKDEAGREVTVLSSMPLVEARQQPLTDERLTSQLGRLGATPYQLGALVNRLQGSVILPMSELNRLRRQVVEQFDTLRATPPPWQLAPPGSYVAVSHPELLEKRPACSDPLSAPGENAAKEDRLNPQLILLVRSIGQLQAALEHDVGTIYCEFEDPKRYREAVRLYRTARPESSSGARGIFVAPPRICKPGEDWILRQVAAAEPDGILVRNYDHLERWAQGPSTLRCVADYSLNVANGLAAEYLLERYRLERLTASYDLNFEQLEALLKSAPAEWFEVTLHQHMPLFHMEHCVFCAFLSEGTDYTNCGRPCDHHAVRLRDRVGAEHWLKADAGCRNTVFNARAQTGAEYAGRLTELGVRRFRIELMDEDPAKVGLLLSMYQALLEGRLSARQLWQELKLHHQLGVTRGAF